MGPDANPMNPMKREILALPKSSLGFSCKRVWGWCMRQVLEAGALGWPRAMGWRGRWEGSSGWRTHVNPWLLHVNVWQKPLQYCKVISLQLIQINRNKNKERISNGKKKKRGYGETQMNSSPTQYRGTEFSPPLSTALLWWGAADLI